MSDNESDNSSIWVIVIIAIILGIIFFFSKDIWPELTSPVLRCLVAPVAGIVLFIGYYLLYVVLPNVAIQVLWKLCLWVSAPRLIFPLNLLIAVGTGVALLFRWIVVPINLLWAALAGSAIGIIGGYFTARLTRLFNPDSWVLSAIVSLPVSIGLTYWISTILQPTLINWLLLLPVTIVVLMVIRFLYEENQYTHTSVSSYRQSSSAHQAVNPSYLPQEMKNMILQQVRDKLGSVQYNQLVSAVGEDEIIRTVLANMQKS